MATNQNTNPNNDTPKTYKSYDPSSTYSWAQAGAQMGSGNLSRYGIDYSQEEQDRIANIFRNEANAAYGAAQNQYSQDIANQQAALSDTIRRSQAEAVATGASRGMQAANELSAMLGLQQAAAQGATQIQGDYASQLAAAQEQAANLQNQRNQVLAQFAEADLEAEAQRYAANLDYAANDFDRIIAQAREYAANGDSARANALLNAYGMANGMDAGQISDLIAGINAGDSGLNTEWKPGQNGYLSDINVQQGKGNYTDLNYSDLNKGKNESGSVTIGGTRYYLEFSGTVADSNTSSALNNIAGGSPKQGAGAIYNNELYVFTGSGWHKAIGTGSGGVNADYKVKENKGSGQTGKAKDYNALKNYLKNG